MTISTQTKKTIALRKVIYSINMFLYTSSNIVDVPNNKNLQNCIIESFLTHTRNLYSFFYENKRYQDDIVCQDFIKKKISRERKNNLKEQINKTLSHLSYFEIEKSRSWDIQEIKDEFFPICLEFLENPLLNQFKLDKEIEKIKKNITTELRNKMHYG